MHTGKFAEAVEVLSKGLAFEQFPQPQPSTASDQDAKPISNTNTQTLLSLIASAKKAPRMESVVPRGVIAQVPVAYYTESPHKINYDAYNDMQALD